MEYAAEILKPKIKRTYFFIIIIYIVSYLLSFIPSPFFLASSNKGLNLSAVLLASSLGIQVLMFFMESIGAKKLALNIFYYGGYGLVILAHILSYFPSVESHFNCSCADSIQCYLCFLGPQLFLGVLKVSEGSLTLRVFSYWMFLYFYFLVAKAIAIYIFKKFVK